MAPSGDTPRVKLVQHLKGRADRYRAAIRQSINAFDFASRPNVIRATGRNVNHYANKLADVVEELEAQEAKPAS